MRSSSNRAPPNTQIQAVDRRDVEVVAELAVPFSVSLVCDLVGLPDEGRERLLPWARLGFDSMGAARTSG